MNPYFAGKKLSDTQRQIATIDDDVKCANRSFGTSAEQGSSLAVQVAEWADPPTRDRANLRGARPAPRYWPWYCANGAAYAADALTEGLAVVASVAKNRSFARAPRRARRPARRSPAPGSAPRPSTAASSRSWLRVGAGAIAQVIVQLAPIIRRHRGALPHGLADHGATIPGAPASAKLSRDVRRPPKMQATAPPASTAPNPSRPAPSHTRKPALAPTLTGA